MLLFLCGADMHPSHIRARCPDARFVDVAQYAGSLPRLTALDDVAVAGGEVWGILVHTEETEVDDEPMQLAVTLPDGEQALATLATRPVDVADAAAVEAAVRYWELPPAYRARIIARDAAR